MTTRIMQRSSQISASAEMTEYSICTLITNKSEFCEMQRSFINGGFGLEDCEYLTIDNSRGNLVDAYEALNIFLLAAQGKYVIICHQDVKLIQGRSELDEALTDLNSRDVHWGVAGNAGAAENGSLHIRISDPRGDDQMVGGPFPVRVVSLDENFLVVRRAANLALSRDLSGFHLYGTDLCLIANILGWTSYVIDFHLLHKSGGNANLSYYDLHAQLQRKYQSAFRARWVPNVIGFPVYVASTATLRRLVKATRIVKLKLGIKSKN